MRPARPSPRIVLICTLLVVAFTFAASCVVSATPHGVTAGPVSPLYLPEIAAARPPTPTPLPTVPVLSGVVWDPRLDLRMAKLIPANVSAGQGYWKLIEGVWFDYGEPLPMGVGDHDIAADAQDPSGVRQLNKAIKVTWTGGQGAFYTQDKPGEKYSATYPMYHVAPTYNVMVDDGFPSDEVDGLGLGTIQYPGMTIHTSYGFVWRWTIATGAAPTPKPTATPGPTATPVPPATPAPIPAGLSWDPRLNQLNTVLVPALVTSGQGYWRLVNGTWYDVGQGPFQSSSLILVDALDASGNRQTGVPIAVSWNDGSALITTLQTEAKPGEPYAANFAMTELRPAYRVQPANGAPADMVYNLGQGSITQPYSKLTTSYGFTWQWTIAP